MTTCTICLRPTDEREPIRHDRCARRLDRNLDALPGLYALMGAVLAPGAVAGGGRVSGNTRTAPLPVRIEPLSLRASGGIVAAVATWEADWRETRGMAPAARGSGERDLSAIVMFLRAHLPWAIEQHPAIVEFDAEIAHLVHECRQAGGLLPVKTRIGVCPALVGEEACGAALYADPTAEAIRCRCGARWGRGQWMMLGKAMREEVEAA